MLRAAILSGDLPPGLALPTSHELAMSLGVSRNTIVTVYSILAAEGFLKSNTRRGTRVAEQPTGRAFQAMQRKTVGERADKGGDTSMVPRNPNDDDYHLPRTLTPLLAAQAPDPGGYSVSLGRILAQEFASPPEPDQGSYAFGAAISSLLRQTRGIHVDSCQVLPVRCLRQALELIAKVLIDPGHWVYLEDPSDGQAWSAMRGAGAQVVAIGESADLPRRVTPLPRMYAVSTSASFPFGAKLSEESRKALVDVANRTNALIFEDDRWWDLSYAGLQQPAIQCSDREGRVIYFGRLQDALGPQVKAGYLVVPKHLVDAFKSAQPLHFAPSPFVLSAVAKFIENPDFATHLQSVRSLYIRRQSLLVEAFRSFRDASVPEPLGGLALTVRWRNAVDEEAICRAVAPLNVAAAPLSACFQAPTGSAPAGIVIGMGTVPERLIDTLVARIGDAASGKIETLAA
jgi:GntR family transcriptional regulator/MocR family aminotransferase